MILILASLSSRVFASSSFYNPFIFSYIFPALEVSLIGVLGVSGDRLKPSGPSSYACNFLAMYIRMVFGCTLFSRARSHQKDCTQEKHKNQGTQPGSLERGPCEGGSGVLLRGPSRQQSNWRNGKKRLQETDQNTSNARDLYYNIYIYICGRDLPVLYERIHICAVTPGSSVQKLIMGQATKSIQ